MAYPKKVKDYAKELYMTPNAYGAKQFSFDEIVEKIKTKFPDLKKFPDPTSIYLWSTTKSVNEKSWKESWKTTIIESITDPILDPDNPIELEADTIEKLKKELIIVHKIGKEIFLKGSEFILNDDYEPKDLREARSLLEIGLKIYELRTNIITDINQGAFRQIYKNKINTETCFERIEKITEFMESGNRDEN